MKARDPNVGGQNLADPVMVKMDRDRSFTVYEKVKSHTKGNSVLDYGGGNGKIMNSFIEHGYACYIADYSDVQLPNVEKVANDIEGLEHRYSIIILSHVLEHVAEPGELISRLKDHLEDDGVVYAEIPIDILGGIRLEGDPVTHINFFTRESLATLFNRNGYQVVSGNTEYGTYGRHQLEVGWLLAQKGDEAPSYKPTSAKKLLWPSRWYALKKLLVEASKS
ncbi:Methyltransferase domain-containing protein [Marinobacter sp. es.048]|uniref:class I SAM-dependent methyltransferase n=1 Tax=Marinobacter sp. es.048 TaxID=1761795 RepID=UPI000B721484|nr:class I SAM-dependent methyltransferase [Marinobacter sp. es.048]SNC68293.1 Methyltransferase domain-containing protein [Marinobacter sp. es.048]